MARSSDDETVVFQREDTQHTQPANDFTTRNSPSPISGTQTPVWGESVSVQRPVQPNAPDFPALQRALSSIHGTESHDSDFDLDTPVEGEGSEFLAGTLERYRKRVESAGLGKRRLDVAWKDLYVRGVGASAVYGATVGSTFNPLTGIRDKRRTAALENSAKSSLPTSISAEKSPLNTPQLGKNERFLLQGLNGVLHSGQMTLVLGRPGAGCSTFLKAICNIREGWAGVDGEVVYGNMNAKEAKMFPGQIVYNSEEDIHYPTLTVKETLDFALKMKTPRTRPDGVTRRQFEEDYLKLLLKTFGIEHTADTLVGDEFVRGVSGGERKRVSIAEVLVNRASVVAWDNSSRGLDASTALEYTRSIRTITNVLGTTSFVSLYQAGNQIFEQFDKVLVLAAGICIYWGPRSEARPYFERMGFVCPPGQNVADYLTGVTVKTERMLADHLKDDFAAQAKLPNTPEQFSRVYLESDVCRHENEALEAFLKDGDRRARLTEEFRKTVGQEKAKSVSKKQPHTAGLWTQVKAATIRQYQLMWNDKGSIAIKQGSSIVQSIILGSLFYMLPNNTAGLFTRGGTLFFILLFNALLGMTEVTASFHGRSILAKHKSFAMYRPSAVVLAQVLADFPILIAQISVFMLPIYFMTQLRQSAGAFFTLWIVTYVTTLSLMGFFRFIGFSFSTFEGASGVSGIAVGLLILYTGYLIPPTSMQVWLKWLRWLNPLYYGFESAMINEFQDRNFACIGANLVPSGQGYSTSGNSNFACTVAGSRPGEAFVSGNAYLGAALNYYPSHLWRNVGIIIGFWIFFVLGTAWSVERLQAAGSEKSYLLFARPSSSSKHHNLNNITEDGPRDEEHGGSTSSTIGEGATNGGLGSRDGQEKAGAKGQKIEQVNTIFTWQNMDYTVNVKDGKRKLLDHVQGYTKPGTLTALMGSSGAGKTTLLDVLALRKEEGVVEGNILIDGRPLGLSFQRTTAYVGQMDIHDGAQTVREALVFSALLRQSRDVPDEEKLAYVDTVLDMLELTDIADALIGRPGAGLGVEQRKRVTIGVELVSKPVLLFLDEPTSGLDGQSSFKIVRFLRKLAEAGQNIICTIHQPSALLFSQFDQLLLLARGGKTVYFGATKEMPGYFAKNGIECPEDANPAEFMIDVVSGSLSKGRNWTEVWLNSEEYQRTTREVTELAKEAAARPPSYKEDGLEYAATMSTQFKLVCARAQKSYWRSPEYIMGRFGLIIGSALVNGMTFLQLDNSSISLQNRLFSVFQGMFVAPGLLNQIQPQFIQYRSLFEAREKPAKLYGWLPFVVAQVLAELPWSIVSATVYYLLWYFSVFPVGISTDAYHAGLMWVIIVIYHIFTLAFGQAIAALSGNANQASLINPIFMGLMASFSGVLVPYGQITAFWRYWLYYLNPWTYLLGAQVFFTMRNVPVVCAESEYARFPPPSGQTCGQYMSSFLSSAAGYLQDSSSTSECAYCQFSSGNDYLKGVNLGDSVDGPRNIGIGALYMFACFLVLFVSMWWRSRPSKKH